MEKLHTKKKHPSTSLKRHTTTEDDLCNLVDRFVLEDETVTKGVRVRANDMALENPNLPRPSRGLDMSRKRNSQAADSLLTQRPIPKHSGQKVHRSSSRSPCSAPIASSQLGVKMPSTKKLVPTSVLPSRLPLPEGHDSRKDNRRNLNPKQSPSNEPEGKGKATKLTPKHDDAAIAEKAEVVVKAQKDNRRNLIRTKKDNGRNIIRAADRFTHEDPKQSPSKEREEKGKATKLIPKYKGVAIAEKAKVMVKAQMDNTGKDSCRNLVCTANRFTQHEDPKGSPCEERAEMAEDTMVEKVKNFAEPQARQFSNLWATPRFINTKEFMVVDPFFAHLAPPKVHGASSSNSGSAASIQEHDNGLKSVILRYFPEWRPR